MKALSVWGFPHSSAGEESTCNAAGLTAWVRSLGWEDLLERERLPTPVVWLGEFHGLHSPWGRKELDTTERLSLSLCRFVNKFYETKFLESLLNILIIVINRRAHHLRRNSSPVLCVIIGFISDHMSSPSCLQYLITNKLPFKILITKIFYKYWVQFAYLVSPTKWGPISIL